MLRVQFCSFSCLAVVVFAVSVQLTSRSLIRRQHSYHSKQEPLPKMNVLSMCFALLLQLHVKIFEASRETLMDCSETVAMILSENNQQQQHRTAPTATNSSYKQGSMVLSLAFLGDANSVCLRDHAQRRTLHSILYNMPRSMLESRPGFPQPLYE